MARKLLFSVTEKDCRFDYYRGSGKGGQKRNKTSSAVRCTHVDSSAVGQSDDTRSQHRNKSIAFGRMANTTKFKNWHRLESARRTGEMKRIDDAVAAALANRNLIVEGKDDKGLWEVIG